MLPESLQNEMVKIIEDSLSKKISQQDPLEGLMLSLDDEQMFYLWNTLGEELGIDLALATKEQRALLFATCRNGRRLPAKELGSLLWLVYYSYPAREQ